MGVEYALLVDGSIVEIRTVGAKYTGRHRVVHGGYVHNKPSIEDFELANWFLVVRPITSETQSLGELVIGSTTVTWAVVDMSPQEIWENELILSDMELSRVIYEIMCNMPGPLKEADYPTSYAEYTNKKSLLDNPPS